MSVRKIHQIWIEQYDAAQDIKLRYGLKAAFDYLVAEKLLNFASAAAEHPEFSRELPRFVSQVRLMFTPLEMKAHIERIERELRDKKIALEDDNDLIQESPATIAKRAGQFATIKELLIATELGTS
ncbi:MAG: hypothetical protein WCG00_14930 [Hyphomicrobiales bacterium]|jgi:hypothetical protein